MSTANLPNTTALTQAIHSAVRPGVFGRLGTLVKKAPTLARNFWNAGSEDGDDNTPPEAETAPYVETEIDVREPRSSFLRPWGRRDAALDALHDGVGALTELMTGIRGALDAQSHRQEEIAGTLGGLTELVRLLPENGKSQLDALTVLQQQMEQQSSRQGQVADILERINQADQQQGRTLDAICQYDAKINQNLLRIGTLIQSVGANSQSGTKTLMTQLRDNIAGRDSQLQQALKATNSRLVVLLSVAISTSVAALGAVAVLGFLVVRHLQ